jgi:hypothetical protein
MYSVMRTFRFPGRSQSRARPSIFSLLHRAYSDTRWLLGWHHGKADERFRCFIEMISSVAVAS